MSTIDEIKAKIDIVDLVSEAGVKLRHAGKNYTGFCPFHDNKHTPAFVIWPESGTWRCFGQCNEGGDIFKFVMKRDGLDFKDALQKLADRAGVKVESLQREAPQVKEANEHLRALLEDAIIYYRTQLFNNKDVLTYLHQKRGLTDATIETFGLGYAPHGYDNLIKHFAPKGYSQQELIDAGMLSVRESDSQTSNTESRSFDRFRNRIMIPIRDENGKMAGFGARIVDPTDIPKFLNSPETPIFTKGHLLYGLDRARKPIRVADQAVIVEGYLDVIALHQAGYENVVSPMGTALTEDQLRLLKKSTRRIVLALDPDTAGQKAVLRGLDAARSAMDREGELGFDARGLLRNEARLQADLRVASMPDDLDPDEIVARDKDEWKRLIENAKPIVTHVMDSLAVGQNLNDAKVKNQIAAQVLPLIEDLPNALERDTYRQALARMLKVDERALMSTQSQVPVLKRRPRGTTQNLQAGQSVVAVNPNLKIESYCLGVLLRRPDLLYRLDKNFQEFGLSTLAVEDFEYTDHQLLFGIVRLAVEQDEKDHHHYVMSHLPETINELSKDLVSQIENLEPVEDKILEDLLARFIDLRRANAMINNNQLRFLQEEDQQQGGANIKMYQEQNLQLAKLIHSLDQAKRKLSLKRQA
ncbi:MAG TPA: DNA primase [Anaerolineales bacterium]|nr:DNA primase [Anaerolineales bacterium]